MLNIKFCIKNLFIRDDEQNEEEEEEENNQVDGKTNDIFFC
jgi:hypothetical protein